MPRPILATFDLAALTHNLGVARRLAPNAKVLAVIKADAYGHGMLRAAAALAGAEGFAVLRVEEGVALREAGFKQTILPLEGFFSEEELPLLAQHRIATVLHDTHQADLLERVKLPSKVDIFLKLNTGMNRLGFTPEAFPAVLQRLQACPNVGSITLISHFACADESVGIASQLECFQRTTQGLSFPRSLANSATVLRYPQAHAEWVRPGIMLYGASPFTDETAQEIGLRPVMTLTSRVIAVQNLQVGEIAGYGGLFRAERPTRVGTVACGYADGYPRHAPTGTPILVSGKRTRTLGRVSMDMLFADLTEIPEARVGSPVTLWGNGLPVEEVAQAAGTIGYELLCALAQRVPVVEMAGGED
ncbi:MAG: alanine racemase [Sulfuricella sp.]|nr:alanine racemase [Sulfuricella sp.]